MSKKKRPTKQQTNPPIKTTVQEPAAKRRYAIIRFIEFDPPKGASPQKKTVLIKTSMTDAEIRELSGNICQIVESAYAEHSYMDDSEFKARTKELNKGWVNDMPLEELQKYEQAHNIPALAPTQLKAIEELKLQTGKKK